jgi:hypothetical protein
MRQSRVLLSTAVAVALGATVLSSGAVAADGNARHAAKGKPYEVTITTNKSELVLGGKVKITGKVSPAAKGKNVILQQKIGDKAWKDQGTDALNKNGRYEFTDKPTTMNARKYRVVKPATPQHKKGVSKAVAVTVLQWHDLYDLEVRQNEQMYVTRSLDINTVEYPKSLYGWIYDGSTDQDGFIDYNIERQCTTLKATYGMSDDADTGSSVKIDVVGDGSQLYTGTFSLLQSQAKTLDIRGVFRLAFEFTSLTPEHPVPAVGSTTVLCSF